MKKYLLALLLLASPALAQTPAAVTGSVFDAGGNVATSGYVEFDISPNASGVQFFVHGVGTIAPPSVQCPISGGGTITCNVWGNDVISPGNTTYTVTFAPAGNVTNVVNGECITGTTYSINAPKFCPQVQVNPQQTIIRSNPFETNIVPNAPDVYNVGSATAYYAAGYFDNIFLKGGTLGTVSSVGLSLPAWLVVAGSPITGSGTFTVTPATGQASHQVIGTCGSATSFTPCTLTAADLSVISIITTAPLTGGPLHATGTVACPTCVTASSPGFGLAHFAGSTQAVTSSLVDLTVDVINLLPNANLAHSSTTVNGQTCTLGSTCTISATEAILAAPTLCNLGSPITSIGAATPQVVIACSTTAPSSGCPCRAFVSWSIAGNGTSSTQQAEAIINDGTSNFDGTSGNIDNQITNGYKGIARSDYSPNLYANNASVTFTLTGESDHTWNIQTATFYLGAPTQVRVTYLSSN